MMWLRRNLPLLIGGLVFIALVAWTLMLYQKAKAHHSEVETKYHALEQQLDHLMKMPVFPSADNIEKLQAQTQMLHSYYRDIHERFPRHSREYPTMTRWDFRAYIGTRVEKLRHECVYSNRVPVATGVAFGFGRYLGNTLVRDEDTPKLLHQLDIVESLVRLIGKIKVAEISTIKRTFLESETDASSERVDGGVWNTDASLIYESQTFEIGFRCSPEQLKAVMNSFARSTNVIVVVRSVAVEADKASPREPAGTGIGTGSTAGTPTAMPPLVPGFPEPRIGGRGAVPPGGRTTAPGGTPESGSGEYPVVMGNELSSVLLRLDVIEMKPPEGRKEKAEAGPRGAPRKET